MHHPSALPRPWTDFAFSRQTFAEAYQAREQEVVDAISSVQGGGGLSRAFRTWAAALEASVDVAIQVAGVPSSAGPVRQGLPRIAADAGQLSGSHGMSLRRLGLLAMETFSPSMK